MYVYGVVVFTSRSPSRIVSRVLQNERFSILLIANVLKPYSAVDNWISA